MNEQPFAYRYHITLLPSLQVVAECATLREAVAWMETYNSIMAGGRLRAVIDQAPATRAAA